MSIQYNSRSFAFLISFMGVLYPMQEQDLTRSPLSGQKRACEALNPRNVGLSTMPLSYNTPRREASFMNAQQGVTPRRAPAGLRERITETTKALLRGDPVKTMLAAPTVPAQPSAVNSASVDACDQNSNAGVHLAAVHQQVPSFPVHIHVAAARAQVLQQQTRAVNQQVPFPVRVNSSPAAPGTADPQFELKSGRLLPGRHPLPVLLQAHLAPLNRNSAAMQQQHTPADFKCFSRSSVKK